MTVRSGPCMRSKEPAGCVSVQLQFLGYCGVLRCGEVADFGGTPDTHSPCFQVFPGNSDNNSHKKNIFETPFMARYVRVLPVSWHNGITMRLELLGC